MYQQCFEKLDELEDKYIKFWCDLASIESMSCDKAGVDRAVDFVLSEAVKLGFDTVKGSEEASGDPACIVMRGGDNENFLALSGHLDTVFPKGLFGEVPVNISDGKIFGPGVNDCKGGVVAALYAMEALSLCGFNKRSVKLILQTDEEVSSRYSDKRTVEFMYEHGKGSVAFLNLEGYENGKCTVQRKGIVRYKVTVGGLAAHSSRCYEGVSAVKEAAHKIIAIEALSEGKTGITVNCGIISGGTAENTVPAECTFSVDLRFPDEEKRKNAEAAIIGIVEHSYLEGTTASLSVQSRRPAMELEERNIKLLEDLNGAFSKCGLPALAPASATGGSDAADMTVRGLRAVDSLGTEGGYIHSRNEYSYLSSLKESARRLVAAALYL